MQGLVRRRDAEQKLWDSGTAYAEKPAVPVEAELTPKKVDADQRYDNDRWVVRLLASTGAASDRKSVV